MPTPKGMFDDVKVFLAPISHEPITLQMDPKWEWGDLAEAAEAMRILARNPIAKTHQIFDMFVDDLIEDIETEDDWSENLPVWLERLSEAAAGINALLTPREATQMAVVWSMWNPVPEPGPLPQKMVDWLRCEDPEQAMQAPPREFLMPAWDGMGTDGYEGISESKTPEDASGILFVTMRLEWKWEGLDPSSLLGRWAASHLLEPERSDWLKLTGLTEGDLKVAEPDTITAAEWLTRRWTPDWIGHQVSGPGWYCPPSTRELGAISLYEKMSGSQSGQKPRYPMPLDRRWHDAWREEMKNLVRAQERDPAKSAKLGELLELTAAREKMYTDVIVSDLVDIVSTAP